MTLLPYSEESQAALQSCIRFHGGFHGDSTQNSIPSSYTDEIQCVKYPFFGFKPRTCCFVWGPPATSLTSSFLQPFCPPCIPSSSCISWLKGWQAALSHMEAIARFWFSSVRELIPAFIQLGWSPPSHHRKNRNNLLSGMTTAATERFGKQQNLELTTRRQEWKAGSLYHYHKQCMTTAPLTLLFPSLLMRDSLCLHENVKHPIR